MVPLSLTLINFDLSFEVTIFFYIEYLRKGTTKNHSGTSVGSQKWCIKQCHFWWPL